MKFFILLATLILSSFSFVPDLHYTVTGSIKNYPSGWAYMLFPDSLGRPFGKRDSARVVNGQFHFDGTLTAGIRVTFYLKGVRGNTDGVFLDEGNVNVEISTEHLYDCKASGNAAQDHYNRFWQQYQPLFLHGNEVYGLKLRARSRHNQKALDSLEAVHNNIVRETREMVAQDIRQNPGSVTSAYFAKLFLTSDPDAALLTPLYNGLTENVKKSIYAAAMRRAIDAGNRTAIGSIAPAFTIADVNRKNISLNQYKGKYTLVDFWASWCGPCRAENPNVLATYQRFKNKGFEVLSVSLDDSKVQWLKAVKEDKPPGYKFAI